MEINSNLKQIEQIIVNNAECVKSNFSKALEASSSNVFNNAILPIIVTYFSKILYDYYKEKKEISGDISVIQSDISSMTEILHEMKIIDGFINAYKDPKNRSKLIWVDEPRKENYFALHEALIQKIGRMPKEIPVKIVKFYNFSKAARDAAYPFSKNNCAMDDDKAQESALYVLLATKNSLEAAKQLLQYKSCFIFMRKRSYENEKQTIEAMIAKINNAIQFN